MSAELKTPLLSTSRQTSVGSTNSSSSSYNKDHHGTIQITKSNVQGILDKTMYDLPLDNVKLKSDLRAKEEVEDKEILPCLDMNLAASLHISANRADEVTNLTNHATFYFNQFLTDLERMKKNQPRHRESNDDEALRKLHSSIGSVVESPAGKLLRQNSILTGGADGDHVMNFSSAKDLLQGGIAGYVGVVRRLFKSEALDSSIQITFKDLDYTVPNPYYREASLHHSAESGDDNIHPSSSSSTTTTTAMSGRDTIGDRLYQIFCCFCLAAFQSIKRMSKKARSIRSTVPDDYDVRSKPRLHVLKGMTGYIPPNRFTLVLGPPGSGKSCVLKALAGKLCRSQNGSQLTGDLKYNAHDVRDLKHLANWVSFCGQTDDHHALLTTRETLNFAFRCRKEVRYTNQDLHRHIARTAGEEHVRKLAALQNVDVDANLAILGLDNCSETIIGNNILKGVSGGEKRRVTLGEMLVTGAQIMCCDEISTGLDSAATFDICSFLRQAAHAFEQTIVVALLQPPPEVIDLFDDILVIADGHIIYHGEVSQVLSYFQGLGFTCPPRKDLGDFLQEIPTVNGTAYFTPGWDGPMQPRLPSEFAARWKSSEMFKNVLRIVNEKLAEVPNPRAINFDMLPNTSTFRRFQLVFSWLWVLRMRAKAQIFVKLIQNVVMGLLFGSLFFQLGFDEWYMKAILLAQLTMFSMSNTIPQGQVMFDQRDILYKHVDAHFYSGIVFTFANFFVSLPFVLFDILVFGNVVYWMCGMANVLYSYILFLAITGMFGLTMNSLMGLVPFLCRTRETQTVMSVMVFILCLLTGGSVATPDVMPSWFRWTYWINPFAWAYRATAINEYHSGLYDQNPCEFNLNGHTIKVGLPCGDFFLQSRQFETSDSYIWLSFAVLGGYLLLSLLANSYALQYIRFEADRAEKDESEEATGKVAHTLEDLAETGSLLRKPSVANNKTDRDNIRYLEAVAAGSVGIGGFSHSETNLSAIPLLKKQQSIVMPEKTLVAKDLWYALDDPDQTELLKGISFWALPGRMTALMGSSGAGKTTLLDVLAGRKTQGTIRGDILVNGLPKVQNDYIRYVGYVEQFGVHCPSATVSESLRFSADLRLPAETTDEQREKFHEETLELLELKDIASNTTSSLSVEQNKRLTIGVELVANPSILFCDEPTSGLDARAAAIVMRAVQRVARTGRTVICTIHQPSSAIFGLFDDLLLLKRGGYVVYFGELGPGATKMIQYLESIPGVPKCPDNYNPATWMLEVIGAGTSAGKQSEHAGVLTDFASVYERSALHSANMKRLEQEMITEFSSLSSPRYLEVQSRQSSNREYTTTFWNQLRVLLHRNVQVYWRSPDFALNRTIVIVFVSILFSCLFWQQKLNETADVQSRILCIAFVVSIIGTYNMFSSIPFGIQNRALFYRERASGLYSVVPYVLAEGMIEIPYVVVECLLGVNIAYWAVGLRADLELWLFFNFAAVLWGILMTYVGSFFAALVKDPMAGQLAAGLFNQMLTVFSGTFVPGNKIPVYYKWLYYMSPLKYLQEALLVTQFHGDDREICNPTGKIVNEHKWSPLYHRVCTTDGSASLSKITGQVTTMEEFALGSFLSSYEYDMRWIDIIVISSWIICIRILTLIIIMTVSHEKR